MNTEEKIAHLQMIQNVITRMANNSFLLKGWCLTIISALVAIVFTNPTKIKTLWIAMLATFVFWVLDTYFLRQERLFRKLYNHVRKTSNEKIDFSMCTDPFTKEKEVQYWRVILSETMWPLYLPIILAMILVYKYIV